MLMKKNRTLFFLILLFVLAGLSVWIYLSRKGMVGVRDDDDREFAYKDTAAITGIFMADKDGQQAHVKRGPKGWTVNEKYLCRSEAILNLLEVIKNLEVKMPVPKEARPHVLKFMSANAIKVEIYKGEELVKQYYVGHETHDGEGSYMLLTNESTGKNFADPYVCFIPGFTGYLQPRFIVNENDWRDRVVMNFIPPDMKSITVTHSGLPDSSFTIELLNTTTFRLVDGKGSAVRFDEAKMRQYLMYFRNVSYEALVTGKNPKLQDSLAAAGPFSSILIATNDFNQHEFRFYRKKFEGQMNPELGVKFAHDPDRMFMSFAGGREWAFVQYFVFGKLLVSNAYFRPAESVKK
jgi:hypothetical protein